MRFKTYSRGAFMQQTFVPEISRRQRIAIIGTGISGMSAAWLLSTKHDVTIYEKAARLGGHSNTVEVHSKGIHCAVDTGFIVYNEACYPNLSALFRYFAVPTQATDMSLGISLDDGALEYAGDGFGTLFAQRRNLLNPRFWSMLRDLVRFYRQAPRHLGQFGNLSIGEWLDVNRFGQAFRDDHLIPMAASIWSAPASRVLDYSAEAFVRFCENHGLLRFSGRPLWRTVEGGSIEYVKKLCAEVGRSIRRMPGAAAISRSAPRSAGNDFPVAIRCVDGSSAHYDAVVIATHADEALTLLEDPSAEESALLGAFRYTQNRVYLHSDPALMPKRRAVWSSWNYLGRRAPFTPELDQRIDSGAPPQPSETLCLTYWMNRLQHVDGRLPLFVTLNPAKVPAKDTLHYETDYAHPLFDLGTLAAQQRLWNLQGQRGSWFCGAYFGSGFHEDGLQSALAVAEQLGQVERPWQVERPSARIHVIAPEIGRHATPAFTGVAP